MTQIEDIIAKAINDNLRILQMWDRPGGPPGSGWKDATASDHASIIIHALDDARFVIAPKIPTEDMRRAGFRVNKFANQHNGEPGCPGVESPPFPVDAFDADVTKCIAPAKLEAWEKAPKCLVASVTLSPEPVWTAMIEARPK